MTSESISHESTDRFSVMGHPVHLLRSYPRWLTARLRNRQGTHVITLNAEMTMQAIQRPALAETLQQADLVIPDGAGVVLYLRLYGRKVRRCAGVELAEQMIRQAAQQDDRPVFFYGGKPEVLDKATLAWQQRLPKLKVVGAVHGYIPPEEEPRVLEKLAETQPSLILVGLGVPRQELWIAAHRHLCPNAIWIGVGGSFDIWSGSKDRAPAWLADNNLEWLYRLYQEPWRWKRMLSLPKFAIKAIVYRLQNPRP
ncbi:WecB/TagA/CpsF family glycosyltransferase [Romeriopsis navalis]|uniref:WecB/TagA/CpsF family glycosyltransferase n=1 Tax=Romeriopsis navalis TaxID=2992132 RepID=UPI0021F83798|nr:WecB/TagA/CpsF family glycosyltransferase [Romeriopsis navalis]